MKTSEIKTEAKKIINSIFATLIKSENKEDWKKAIEYIDKSIFQLENWDRWEEMFIWINVKSQIIFLFWKKFISKWKIVYF